MQGDLKKTYTRSYRISTFKRKMKKRALRRRPEVKLGVICCSSLHTDPETDPVSLDVCEKDILGSEVDAHPKSNVELPPVPVNDANDIPEDRVCGSNVAGDVPDEATQTFPCDAVQECDEESETHIKRPRIATDCPLLLGIAVRSPDSLSGSPGTSHPTSHCVLDEESCMHLALGHLKAPTEILLPDHSGNVSTADSRGVEHFESIAVDIGRLKSGVCSLAQSLKDVDMLKRDEKERYHGLVDCHHGATAIRILTDQAEALAKYRSMLGRICTERDTAIAAHIAMLFSRATQLLDSISLDGVSQGIGRLDMLAGCLVSSRHIEAKDGAMKALEEDLQSVTVKASIQEEQIEYLVRQADLLRRNNHALEHCLGMVTASCTALLKQISDVEADHKHMRSLFHAAHTHSCSKMREILGDVCGIRDRVECLRSDVDAGMDALRIAELVRGSIEEIVDEYESQISALRASQQDLEGRIQDLSCEASELRERNASLLESNRYMEEEIELKNTYAKEMESTFEELMKSNKFYEDQLIKSDDALRSLKEKQTRSSMGFASEVERMRKAHLKECGMLKLRIEELELELANRNN